jgi:hypothetical protein
LAGSLADGSALSQSTAASEDGLWALFVPLYGGRGYLLGWLSLNPSQRVAPLDWLMPPMLAKSYYTNGFDQDREALLTRYQKPPAKQNAVAWTNAEAVIHLLNGQAPQALTNQVMLTNNTLRVLGGSISNLTLSVTVSNGLFTGTFKHPADGKVASFKGALLQDPAPFFYSGGWFLGTNGQGGIIRFHPQ